MKKLKYLFVLLVALLILPFSVFAEDGEEPTEATNTEQTEQATSSDESKEVKIYFFRGEGCPHCQEAEEWFKSIEEEYGSYFEVVDYEVWNDEDNNALMEKVAKARGEKAEGVPYIIIGDKSWSGFTESYEKEMIDQIKTMFEQDVKDRYDIMSYIGKSKSTKKEKKDSNDVVSLLLVLLAVGGVGFGVYKLRESN